ncbi:gp405 [Bacillus phage G]|uniref:Gp405 n=1 Tax=Bacillus phage G TaxID=2884420 RepID=G3MAE6_9CAUD|nr:gp405 [Bacillus phage G]AEO93663.1 gp405 [Bacillus phage G]
MIKTTLNILTGIMIGALVFSTAGTSAKTNEVKVLNYDVYMDGEKLQLGKKQGYFYDNGKYVNPTISYNDTTYVPLNYFSHLTPEYQIYEEDSSVFVNSPEKQEVNIFEKQEVNIFEEQEVVANVESKQEQKINSNEITKDDLILYGPNIKSLDDSASTVKRIKSSYKGVVVSKSDEFHFITDSEYTDTSYFLTLMSNNKGQVIGASYEEFIRPDQSSLNVSTKRGIKVRKSTVQDVIKAYGDKYEKESYSYPDGSSLYTLSYPFELDNGQAGFLTFRADVKKGQNVNKSTIYGFEFTLDNF